MSFLGVDWTAVGAIATVILAAFTAFLARATYRLAKETRELAGTTTEELDLLKEQTQAQVDQAALLKAEREEAARPALTWFHQGAQPVGDQRHIQLTLTNRGSTVFLSAIRIDPISVQLVGPDHYDLNATIEPGSTFPVMLRVTDFAGHDESVARVTATARHYSSGVKNVDLPIDVVLNAAGDFHLRPA